MGLDNRTLIVDAGLASFILAGILLLETRQQRRGNWLRLWAYALVSSGLANFGYALQGVIPMEFTSRVGFIFGIAAVAGMLAALRSFDGLPVRGWTMGGVLALVIAGHEVLVAAHAPERGLITYASFCFGPWLALSAIRGFAFPAATRRDARLVLGLAFTIWAAAFFARGLHALSGVDPNTALLQSSAVQTGFLLLHFTALFAASFAFVIMSKQRSDAEALALASTDALTGLMNRRSFMESAALHTARLRRDGSTASILAIDLDHFKAINDTYGHRAGDAALCVFASIVKSELREIDLACRLGGEEFAVLLCDADLAQAEAIAERVRAKLQAGEIAFEGQTFSVLASFGVAEFGRSDPSFELALGLADAALYRAKSSGRNRVVCDGQPLVLQD